MLSLGPTSRQRLFVCIEEAHLLGATERLVSMLKESRKYGIGTILANILLTDEIHRATPRTQSALLEAMQEQQVTVDGVTRALPRPFMVLATQNPIEYEGTFPLPEAQLDLFLMRLSIGYPSQADEQELLNSLRREHPITRLQPLSFFLPGQGKQPSGDGTLGLPLDFQHQVWDVHVDETLEACIVRLVTATRSHSDLVLGASPRASLALYKTAQALVALRGRDHVIPDDIKYLAPVTLVHRLIVCPESELRGRTAVLILQDVIKDTPLDIGSIQK